MHEPVLDDVESKEELEEAVKALWHVRTVGSELVIKTL